MCGYIPILLKCKTEVADNNLFFSILLQTSQNIRFRVAIGDFGYNSEEADFIIHLI